MVLSTLRRPILMPRSCCSRPGTRFRESYPTLSDTASILQTEPSRVDRYGSTSCIRHLAFTTSLRVKLPNSYPPSRLNLDGLGLNKYLFHDTYSSIYDLLSIDIITHLSYVYYQPALVNVVLQHSIRGYPSLGRTVYAAAIKGTK